MRSQKGKARSIFIWSGRVRCGMEANACRGEDEVAGETESEGEREEARMDAASESREPGALLEAGTNLGVLLSVEVE